MTTTTDEAGGLDYLTRGEAEVLARRIEAFWAENGAPGRGA